MEGLNPGLTVVGAEQQRATSSIQAKQEAVLLPSQGGLMGNLDRERCIGRCTASHVDAAIRIAHDGLGLFILVATDVGGIPERFEIGREAGNEGVDIGHIGLTYSTHRRRQVIRQRFPGDVNVAVLIHIHGRQKVVLPTAIVRVG